MVIRTKSYFWFIMKFREVEEQLREGEVAAKKSLGNKEGSLQGMQMVREENWFQKI